MNYIYLITDIKNNKTYIGQRNKPSLNDDKYLGSPNKGTNYYNIIRKRKKDLKKEILIEGNFSPKQLSDLEIFYISYYKFFNKAEYNISLGGGTGSYGVYYDTKGGNNPMAIKIIELSTMKKFNYIKEAINYFNLKGKESIIKKALKEKRQYKTNLFFVYLSELNDNKDELMNEILLKTDIWNKQHFINLSNARKGSKTTEFCKKRSSETHKGKSKSLAQKKKMSEAARLRWSLLDKEQRLIISKNSWEKRRKKLVKN